MQGLLHQALQEGQQLDLCCSLLQQLLQNKCCHVNMHSMCVQAGCVNKQYVYICVASGSAEGTTAGLVLFAVAAAPAK